MQRQRVSQIGSYHSVQTRFTRARTQEQCFPAVVATHRTLITSILRSISPRFGFAEWRQMVTPDVFSLRFEELRPIAFERL